MTRPRLWPPPPPRSTSAGPAVASCAPGPIAALCVSASEHLVRWELLSSKPYKEPCRISVATSLQCGHGVCLSRSALAFHSSALRQNRCSPTRPPPKTVILRSRRKRGSGVAAGYDFWSLSEVQGKIPGRPVCRIPGVTPIRRPDANSATARRKCDQSGVRNSPCGLRLAAGIRHRRRLINPSPGPGVRLAFGRTMK